MNRPGSLYLSASSVFVSHTPRAKFGSMMAGGSFLVACAVISSIVAFMPSAVPWSYMSAQRLIVASDIISGFFALISAITPMPSE